MGAVIITGETARKENASQVLQALSGYAGDFVVATAGPDLESIIAGKGACSHQYSQEHHTSVVNIDIGGGTSNLAAFREGDVIDTGCFDIGGRLIKSIRRPSGLAILLQNCKRSLQSRGFSWQLVKRSIGLIWIG